MTVGKFISGTIKFVVNLVVILVVGMSAYYIYSEFTTLAPEAAVIELEPDGTNFGKDPTSYLSDATIAKVLKGEYFIDSASGLGAQVIRQAVQNGLTYYPYDYSEDFPATEIYKNANMNNINIWLGNQGVTQRYGYTEFDAYDYDAGRPKLSLDGLSLVAPSFSFQDLDDMKAQLYAYFSAHTEVADNILAYWYLRIGSQVNTYVVTKATRMTGSGSGGGGMSGIYLSGTLLLNTLSFNYYGYTLDKNATIIVDASAKVARQVLAPLLTVADFKLTGWRGTEEIYYGATAKNDISKLSSDAYAGPDGVYVKSGTTKGVAPNEAELESLYNDYTPVRKTFDDEITTLEKLKLCEFGMPATTLSNHKLDLRSIKSVVLKDGAGYYQADITAYTYGDNTAEVDWEWVSYSAAKSLADNIGGFATYDENGKQTGGVVGYLRYTTLTATVGVWESGLVKTWGTQENWEASLAGLIEMKTDVLSLEGYSYDKNDILVDKRNLGVSLPGQIEKLRGLVG
ncbi:MAG: hypothetical protein LBT30_02535 [Clostridiales bacterium]|jgi:hypothetical protein|nr:hypothetical protein [Clostridiales bacterium]